MRGRRKKAKITTRYVAFVKLHPAKTYHMHTAAFTTSASALLSCQLGKNPLNRNTHKMSPSVYTIGGNYVILLSHRSLHAGGDSFLARVQVAEAAHNLLFVEITGGCFETANGLHLAVHVQGFVAGHADSRRWFAVKTVGFEGLVGIEMEIKKYFV